MSKEDYRTMTVRDLVKFVQNDKEMFPQGIDTPISSGDFEGNYHHVKHSLMVDWIGRRRALFIGYEMHETDGR